MSPAPRAAVAASTYSLPPPDLLPVSSLPPQPPRRSQSTNGLSVTSLVLGIMGLMLPPLALLALILGIVGKLQTNRTGQPGGGLAVAGITLGAFVIAMWSLILIGLYVVFAG